MKGYFEKIFEQPEDPTETPEMNCGRIKNYMVKEYSLPNSLFEVFEQGSRNLNFEQKKEYCILLKKFQDLFSENIVAGNCEVIKHRIRLSDPHPIKQAPRRIPIHLREEVGRIIEEMKTQGVIEESKSPWVSPVVLVKKKEGTIRFCVDYRKLNAVTHKDSYPLPRIDDILDQLAGNVWFTTLDLKSGYWQVKISSEDKEKTAFSCGNGLWQFNVMPFRLCNAPATFERLMERTLQKLISKVCFVYLDDVIVYGKTFAEMLENLKEVFHCLQAANLKLNPKKCIFFQKEIKYLGHLVSEKGIATDPKKISAVKDWPPPKTKKQVRSFLGLSSYYRKFVKNFSLIAKPLFLLTENNVKFNWTFECDLAFEKLKQNLITSPILSFPSGKGEFIIDADASNHGIGVVLSQIQDGKERVISYYSRVFSKSERNYCVTRRELLAVVDAMKSFHHYLCGRKFLVRTDHISLRWLMSFRNLEGQLARWLERLQQYDFEIVHRAGKSHGNADGLSRRPCDKIKCSYCEKQEFREDSMEANNIGRIMLSKVELQEWRAAQVQDPTIFLILQAKETGSRPHWQEIAPHDVYTKIYWSYWDALIVRNGVLHKKWESPNLEKVVLQIVVPRSKIHYILKEAHDSPLGGHFGINRTLGKIRKNYYWATCKRDVEDWCASCRICISRKGPSGKGKSPLQVYNVGAPFERIQVDILGPLPVSQSGNKYLLVVVDCFTKWPEALPLKNKRAITIAEALVNQIFSRHGIPLELHTDQGRNFESQLVGELSSILGVKKTRTTALHPQSDGQVERQHRTILNYLSKFIAENQKDWDRWIPMYLMAARSSKHETTKFTPAEMYLGQDLRLPLDLIRGCSPSSLSSDENVEGNYVFNLRRKLEDIHHNVRRNLEIKSRNVKSWYDRQARQVLFEPGQKVWFHNPRRSEGKAPKLQSSWEGPYLVLKRLSDVVYCIRKTPRHRNKIVHADRIALFRDRKID